MADVWTLHTHQVNAYCWYKGIFTDEELDKISDLSNKLIMQDAKIGGDNTIDSTDCGQVMLDIRKTSIAWVPIGADEDWIYRRLTDVVNVANDKWFEFDLRHIEGLQFTVYEKGMHYIKHVDTMYQAIGKYPRKLSFSLQLTDPSEYEGGELLIYNGHQPIVATKEKGSITFFPSYMLHEVTPVTNGIRKCLVGWIHGPKWK